MKNFWLLVADASRARFFKGPYPHADLVEFHCLVNEEMRSKEGSLVSDRTGNFGNGNSADETQWRDESVASFVRAISTFVDKGRSSGEFDRLTIIAAPAVLGKLRKTFKPATKQLIIEEIVKDITTADPAHLQTYIANRPW